MAWRFLFLSWGEFVLLGDEQRRNTQGGCVRVPRRG